MAMLNTSTDHVTYGAMDITSPKGNGISGSRSNN